MWPLWECGSRAPLIVAPVRLVVNTPCLRWRVSAREVCEGHKPYAAFVRSGRRRPHSSHWQALPLLVGVSPDV